MAFLCRTKLPHFSPSSREALNEKFANTWIGLYGPILWSQLTSNLTPLDFFFFWKYIKNIVYHDEIADISRIKYEIIAAMKTNSRDDSQD